MAGTERIELPLTEPESVVLPLDDVPIGVAYAPLREKVIYATGEWCASGIWEKLVAHASFAAPFVVASLLSCENFPGPVVVELLAR